MRKVAKKTPIKRKYTKRAINHLKETKAKFKIALDEYVEREPKKEVDELAFLDAVVLGMEQLLPEQKTRIINYLYSRYWMFITLSKLTQ